MRRKSRKTAAFLAAVLAAALCLCQTVFAAPESAGTDADGQTAERGGIDLDREVTLSIDLEGQDKKAAMALYYVGEWDGSLGAYGPADAFKGADVPLAELTADAGMTVDEMETACAALASYAAANGIQPEERKETEGGKLQFGPTAPGLYLVAQAGDDSTFKVTSFLIALPLLEDGVWDYAVEAYPKNAVVPVSPPASTGPAGGNNGGSSSSQGDRASAVSVSTVDEGQGTALDTIEEEATPLGERILETIEDALAPLTGLLPKTGDRSIAYLPLFLIAIASGAGIIVLVGRRKRCM